MPQHDAEQRVPIDRWLAVHDEDVGQAPDGSEPQFRAGLDFDECDFRRWAVFVNARIDDGDGKAIHFFHAAKLNAAISCDDWRTLHHGLCFRLWRELG